MKFKKDIKKINKYADDLAKLDDLTLQAKTEEFKQRYKDGETLDSLLHEAFAVVREATDRILNKRHYDVQLMGGIVLHKGMVAEMKTGEGKTLTELLPAYLNALSGNKVHIVTVNDYLANRDKDEMGKVFHFLGLTVGITSHGMTLLQKQKAYEADIIYGTSSEFGFDYLRNNTVKSEKEQTQNGLFYAIIDEVDSILIDEAKTPLILSGASKKEALYYEECAELAATMTRGELIIKTKFEKMSELDQKKNEESYDNYDYLVEQEKNIVITQKGLNKIKQAFNITNLTEKLTGKTGAILHLMRQAITAKELMQLDRDYVIKNGEIQIVDKLTGRIMDGRRYNEGLHQAIEAKEKVEVKNEDRTVASISIQKFYMLYDKIAGMTGTGETEKDEFQYVYNMDVVVIPTNKPTIRKDKSDIIFAKKADKYEKIVEVIKEHLPQPILIGVTTIHQSETLAQYLLEQGIENFQTLNAKNHEKEAQIIAQAGRSNTITIATNMAGRGTDIMLGGNPEFIAIGQLYKERFKEEEILIAANFADNIPKDDPNYQRLTECKKRYQALYAEEDVKCKEDKEKVLELGGLFVLGTEKNEARRIDNQLRGRSGRQGDPGLTQFIISLEDEWLLPFKPKEPSVKETNQALQGKIQKFVNECQKDLETQGYDSRKRLLEYDEVDDIIRSTVYGLRDRALKPTFMDLMLKDFDNAVIKGIKYIADHIEERTKDLKVDEICSVYYQELIRQEDDEQSFLIPITKVEPFIQVDSVSKAKQDFIKILTEEYPERASYIEKRYKYRNKPLSQIKSEIMLQSIDELWEDMMVELSNEKESATMNIYGVKQPVEHYKEKVYDLYNDFIASLQMLIAITFFYTEFSDPEYTKKAS